MGGAEHRPGQVRPFGLPNLAADGGGGNGGVSEAPHGKAFSFYFYHLKRRYVEHFSLHLGYLPYHTNPATEVSSLAKRMREETEYDGSPVAKDTAYRLERAVFALTFAHIPDVFLKHAIAYEDKNYEARNAEKGQAVRGVEIHAGEEKNYLAWMLKKAEVPVDLGEGDICIPFSTLEWEMQQVAEDIKKRT